MNATRGRVICLVQYNYCKKNEHSRFSLNPIFHEKSLFQSKEIVQLAPQVRHKKSGFPSTLLWLQLYSSKASMIHSGINPFSIPKSSFRNLGYSGTYHICTIQKPLSSFVTVPLQIRQKQVFWICHSVLSPPYKTLNLWFQGINEKSKMEFRI